MKPSGVTLFLRRDARPLEGRMPLQRHAGLCAVTLPEKTRAQSLVIEIGYAKVLACRVRRFGLPLYDVKACEALTARSGLLRFRKALSFSRL
jgi:hypothetical protein